ncbi:MAG: DNA polymerase III subunit delta' C-terminal domain-containing protein [Terriglobales bacterium]
MPFADFCGNGPAVARLRRLIAAEGMNRTLILAGPRGVGKATLAIFAGLALNCQAPPEPGDFCGHCPSCAQLSPAWRDLPSQIAAAIAFRDQQVKSGAKEAAPLILAVHPFIEIFPPDGDFLTLAQARRITHRLQGKTGAGHVHAVILPEFDAARWMVQNALLKTLEEPPPRACLLVLARNPMELLPTVRSRALRIALSPVPGAAIEAWLQRQPPPWSDTSPEERAAAARLAQGSPGLALSQDWNAYRALREQALALLAGGLDPDDPRSLFELTARLFPPGRAGKEKLESLIEILYSLLQDILYITAGCAAAIRNWDCQAELAALAARLNLRHLSRAIEEADQMAAAAQRNAQRGLALEAWALRLTRATGAAWA